MCLYCLCFVPADSTYVISYDVNKRLADITFVYWRNMSIPIFYLCMFPLLFISFLLTIQTEQQTVLDKFSNFPNVSWEIFE